MHVLYVSVTIVARTNEENMKTYEGEPRGITVTKTAMVFSRYVCYLGNFTVNWVPFLGLLSTSISAKCI